MAKAIIGVPINAKTGYILNRFLKNQEEIQKAFNGEIETVFATEDVLFAQKLKKVLKNYKINSNVITFKPNRPKDAKDRI